MAYYCAQINEEDIVFAIAALTSEIINPKVIEITEEDFGLGMANQDYLMGKKYVNGEFINVG